MGIQISCHIYIEVQYIISLNNFISILIFLPITPFTNKIIPIWGFNLK
jgi:hypothetical protein